MGGCCLLWAVMCPDGRLESVQVRRSIHLRCQAQPWIHLAALSGASVSDWTDSTVSGWRVKMVREKVMVTITISHKYYFV